MNDQRRSDMVTRVTTVLAEVDDDPDRMANEPVAWVHITEVPEGNWGALGRVVRFPEIAEYVLTGAIG
jgi:phenylpyruvate tautomerase PptA (4-oxalocrotonate tautomerase family)